VHFMKVKKSNRKRGRGRRAIEWWKEKGVLSVLHQGSILLSLFSAIFRRNIGFFLKKIWPNFWPIKAEF
jgi:hypothetical protein